jgi:hypothetical protein
MTSATQTVAVQHSTSGEYGHVYVRPVGAYSDGTLKFTRMYDEPVWQFSCQLGGGADSLTANIDGDGSYCWRLGAEDCHDVRQVEATLKAMRAMVKRYEKNVDAYGTPATFATFVAYHFAPGQQAHAAPFDGASMPVLTAVHVAVAQVRKATRKNTEAMTTR